MGITTRSLLVVSILILLAGCASRGPVQLEQDQFDYGKFLSESRKNQALMNIVRIRYLDWPIFLEVHFQARRVYGY